jgi:hypothetical protein
MSEKVQPAIHSYRFLCGWVLSDYTPEEVFFYYDTYEPEGLRETHKKLEISFKCKSCHKEHTIVLHEY